MKKILSVLLAAAMVMSMLAGCGSSADNAPAAPQRKRLRQAKAKRRLKRRRKQKRLQREQQSP